MSPVTKKMKVLLKTILIDDGVISGPIAFATLMATLCTSKQWRAMPATLSFVENCVSRIFKQPVHYLDLRSLMTSPDTDHNSCDMLIVCVAEQWPFTAKNEGMEAQKNVAEWIARLFSAIEAAPEQGIDLVAISSQMMREVEEDARCILKKAFEKQSKHPVKIEEASPDEPFANGVMVFEESKSESPEVHLEDAFGISAKVPKSLEGLDRWDTTDLETAVSNGRLGRLQQCLASEEEEEIRRQAFLILRTLMGQVKVTFLSSLASM